MAYATIEQLEVSWRDFAPFEVPHIEQALADASVFLDCLLEKSGKSAADCSADALRIVCCNIVRRSFGELDPTNADEQWQTLTSQDRVDVTPAVKHGDFYPTQWEKRMLGIRCGRCGFADGE